MLAVRARSAVGQRDFPGRGRRQWIGPGVRWKGRAARANTRCEAVICLLSRSWETSRECQVEYRTAENLNKEILCARLEEGTGQDLTSEWQRVDLFGAGPHTCIEVRGGPPMLLATEGPILLRDAIRGAGISAEAFVWPPPADPDRAPYRGWEPFEPIDARVSASRRFCGPGCCRGSAAKTAVSCRWALCARSACR
jgi:TIR domain